MCAKIIILVALLYITKSRKFRIKRYSVLKLWCSNIKAVPDKPNCPPPNELPYHGLLYSQISIRANSSRLEVPLGFSVLNS